MGSVLAEVGTPRPERLGPTCRSDKLGGSSRRIVAATSDRMGGGKDDRGSCEHK